MTVKNRSWHFHWILAFVATLGLQTAFSRHSYSWLQEPAPEVFEINSSEPIFDWILEEETGRVFASTLKGDEIIEFSPTMKTEIRRFQVGKKPERLLIKNRRLLVLCQEPTQLVVIDLATNKLAAKMTLDCKYLCDVTATALDDPFVYVIAGHNNKFGDPVIYKINLETRKVVGSLKEQQGYREYIVNGAISDLGSGFVFDRRGFVSPSGADFASLDFAESSFVRKTQSRESYAVVSPGPADRYWTLGPTLVSFDKLKPIRKFGGHMVTIHRSDDLAVTLDVVDRNVEFWQFSNAKKIQSVKLDGLDTQIKTTGTRKKTWKYNRDVADPRLQFDRRNKAVFCGLRTSAFLIPYSSLKVQPQVLIASIPQRRIQLGDELNATLKLTNDQLTEKAEFKLVSGPEKAVVNGRNLVWKPSVADVGDHQLVISTTVDGVSDSLTLNLSVLGNEIDLGLPTQTWAVSPSGKFAVAWGFNQSDRRNFGGSNSQGTPMEMLIVDLEAGKIINKDTNDKPIQAAAIDDKYVYVVPQNSNVLNRYLIEDLENKKRVFLPGTGTGLRSTTDGKLIAHYRGDGRGLSSLLQTVIEPETLKSNSTDPRTGGFSNSTSFVNYTRLNGGEDSDGQHVYDAKTGKVNQILQVFNTGLQVLDENSLRNFQSNFGQMPTAKRWGRTYDRSSLRDGKGNQICQIQYPFAISPDYPIGVGFQSSQTREGRITTTTGQFRFYDLLEGAEIGKQSLFKSSSSIGRSSGYFSSGGMVELIHIRGKVCHTLFNGKIYSAQIPDEVLEKAKSPLRVVHPKKLHVDLMQPQASIQFETPGYANVKFSMVNSVKHVAIDESSGLLTIDTAKIWQDKIGGAVSNRSPFGRTGRLRNNEQRVKTELVAKRRYQLNDDQVGYLLPLSITATGDDGQTDRVQFCLVATGDKKVIDKKVELLTKQQMELERQQAKQRAERQAAMEEARQAEMKRQETERNPSPEKDTEISDLKRKIRRLEAVIDSLIDRIEKLEKKKD